MLGIVPWSYVYIASAVNDLGPMIFVIKQRKNDEIVHSMYY